MGSCLNNQKNLYYRDPIGYDGQTANINQSKKSYQPTPDEVILAQKAMGGSQDIYDIYHSSKRYGQSQQNIPLPIPNNNLYPPQNRSVVNQLNPYVCQSSFLNSQSKNVSPNNNKQVISSYQKPKSANMGNNNNMNYSRKYTKQDVNMKMTASQYMDDD